jgi:hypothetical protein
MQVVAAVVVGIVLAVASTTGIVAVQESRSDESSAQPLYNYGDRQP